MDGIFCSFFRLFNPYLSLLIYALTIVLVLKYVNKKAIHFELNKTGFPIVGYSITVIIALFLNPIGNKLTGLLAEKLSSTAEYETSEFLEFFGLTQASMAICRWIAIIILSIYFYRIYKKKEIETLQ